MRSQPNVVHDRQDADGQPVRLADRKIRFVTHGAELKLEARFDLKQMQFKEQLSL